MAFKQQLRGLLGSLAGSVLLALQPAAAEPTYPSRPIRLIVPFAPGGTTDAVARAVATKLGQALNQSIVVENRAGAGGSIGTDFVAKARPDGYTLLLGSAGPLSVNPTLYPNLPYDPTRDFTPVGMICTSALVLVTSSASGIASTADLIRQAKANPGSLTFSTAGVGGASHIAAELFASMAGIKATHVPYRGSGPATVAAVAGETSFTFTGQTAAWPMVQAGKLRALGVGSRERSAEHPEVPTVAESGPVPGYEALDWNVIMAPPGTPESVVRALSDGLDRILDDPELRASFVQQGIAIRKGTAADVQALMRHDIAKWAKVIEEAGIETQ